MKAVSLVSPFLKGNGANFTEVTLFSEDVEVEGGDILMLLPDGGEILVHDSYTVEDYFERYRVIKGKFISTNTIDATMTENVSGFLKMGSIVKH